MIVLFHEGFFSGGGGNDACGAIPEENFVCPEVASGAPKI